MERKPKESDWKVFRRRVPEWRERYLKKKNKEIIGVLSDENKTPTEQFWDAKEKMKIEAMNYEDLPERWKRKIKEYLALLRWASPLCLIGVDRVNSAIRPCLCDYPCLRQSRCGRRQCS